MTRRRMFLKSLFCWAHRRRRGAAAVETAIVLPLLLVILVGFIDVGRLFYSQLTLKQATVEIARVLAYGAERDDAALVDNMRTTLMHDALVLAKGGLDYNASVSSTVCPEGVPIDGSNSAVVTLDYGFRWFTPLGILAGGSDSLGSDQSFSVVSSAVCQA